MKLIRVKCKDDGNLFEIAGKIKWRKALKDWRQIDVREKFLSGMEIVRVIIDGWHYEASARIYSHGEDINAFISLQTLSNHDGVKELFNKILSKLPSNYKLDSFGDIRYQIKLPLTNPDGLEKISKQWHQMWKQFEKTVKSFE